MITNKRLISVVTILAVILLQLSSAYRALADDGLPPGETPAATQTEDLSLTATETPEATPTEEVTPAETVTPDPEATATPAATDTLTPDPEATATPAPAETVTPDSACDPAVDAAGCAQPPDVTIPYSDPVWCPEGTLPGDAACTPPQASITDLINYLVAHPALYTGNGAIYFSTGVYAGPETLIRIDYTVVPQLGTLSLLGGWDLGGTNTLTGTTTFNVPLQIVWDTDVTLADIVVSLGGGSTDVGIFVSTGGNIILDHVTTLGGYSGAILENSGGTGGVTITSSVFSNNTNYGLQIYSSGSVSLADVTADNNNNGIFIDTTSGTGTVTLNNIFATGNGWTGVDVRSAGDITLDTVTAGGGIVGANLDTTAGSGNIFVTGSTFTGNDSLGLKAVTDTGNITVTGVQTDNGNVAGSFGAWLKSYGGGSIAVTDSVFGNADTGLFIVGTGTVTLTNVTATGNAGNGAQIESGWVFGCFGPDGIPVTVDGGVYQDNGGYGFVVYPGPNGVVTLAGTITYLTNTNGDSLIDLTRSCVPASDETPQKPYQVVELTGKGDDPVQPDCELYSGVILIAPDQSRIIVTCPVTGDVTVADVAKDKLPGAVPQSDEVISGETVTAGGSALIPGGGTLQMCFKIPAGMENKHFAILFWDPIANSGAGGWIELPVNPFGGQIFPLHPKTPEDGLLILEGVHPAGGCVCVTVNFTGTFILVAR
jgi:hypothetical protein